MITEKRSTLFLFIFTSWAIYLIFCQYANFADDPGVGWHIKTGEYVNYHLSPPKQDPFLFSNTPRSWVSDQWLSDFIIYKFFEAGSWPLVYSMLSAVFFSCFCLISYNALRAENTHFLAALISLIPAIRLAMVHFIMRPVVFSMLLFAILYFFLIKIKNRNPGLRDIAALSILFMLWANTHPSFVVGLALILIYNFLCGLNLERFFLFLSPAIFTLFNPYGIGLHESIIQLARSSYFMNLNDEWKPLSLFSEEFILALIVCLLSFYGYYKNRALYRDKFEAIILVAGFILLFHSIRFLPYFAIVSILPLSKGISALFAVFPKFNILSIYPSIRIQRVLLIASIISFILLPRFGQLGPSQDVFPYACIGRLQENSSKRETHPKVLAHPNLGGFIILNNMKAIIDDRNTMLGEEIYRKFFENMVPGDNFMNFVKSTGASHLVLSKNSALIGFISAKKLLNEMDCGDEAGRFKLFSIDGSESKYPHI